MKNKRPLISEDDPYQPDNVPLYEAIYGKNLISLGGLPAIDNLFSGLNIKGLKALDLGFGLGGVAFYLAKHYQMELSGIEKQPWMVQYAHKNCPKSLSDMIEFNTYDEAGNLPYMSETFDLVYSKGVLNHISDKQPLFNQIHRILKPSGLFVIADWIFPRVVVESTVALVCETEESYTQTLTDAGFSEIDFRDDSHLFLGYAKELLAKLEYHRDFIEREYDHELFSAIWEQHEDLINKINLKEKIAIRIIAKKV